MNLSLGMKHRQFFFGVTIYLTLALLFIIATFPMYWMALTSFREPRAVFEREGLLLPHNLTLENYVDVIAERGALRWIWNSTVVAASSSIVSTAVSTLAAYSLVRLRFPGKKLWIRAIVMMYLVPTALLFIPLFITFSELSLDNSHIGLTIAHLTFEVPFMTWFLMGYIKTIPRELEEAGMIDGCGRFSVLYRIILPLIGPGVIAAWIFGFSRSWNEFLLASVLIIDTNLKTVPVAMAGFLVGDIWLWGPLMATAVLATIPAIVLYMFAQRYLVRGLTAGSVKG